MTSVLSAVRSQNTRILELLLQGPTNRKDVQEAFFFACQEGLVECVSCLIRNGVDLSQASCGGKHPLDIAVREGHVEVVTALCQAGVKVSGEYNSRTPPVHVAACYGRTACLKVLIDHGYTINGQDSSWCTPMILAVKNKQYGVIRLLLDTGCEVNIRDQQGRSALHYASLTGTAVEQLINAGADVNISDMDGSTPLLYAATEGLDTVLTSLINVSDCDVNKANESAGKTPLHILSYKGHHHIVKLLLERGAVIDAMDVHFKTPMWYAVANGHVEVVKNILLHSFKDEQCKCPAEAASHCPVQLAFDKGLTGIIMLFILTQYDVHHTRTCLIHQSDVTMGLFADKDDWLIQQGRGVLTLQQLSRKCIRHHMKKPAMENITMLPVPNKFISFLLLKEITDTL